MGLGPRFSICKLDEPSSTPLPQRSRFPNPDPTNFEIKRIESVGKFTIVKVAYPGCTNFEGKKILVFEAGIREVREMKKMDPHFCEHDHISPIARFAPTQKGWRYAIAFCKSASRIR